MPILPRPYRILMPWLAAMTLLAAPPASARTTAETTDQGGDRTANYLRAPAGGGEEARCDWFSRLKRFVDETKRDCDEGRAVKPGPITRSILDRCRAEQGARFDRLPADDMIAGFGRQVQAQGFGNACHEIKQQAWDLIEQ